MLSALLLLLPVAAKVATASQLTERTIPSIYLNDILNCGAPNVKCKCTDPNGFAVCNNGNCGTSCVDSCFFDIFKTKACQPNTVSRCGASGTPCAPPKSNGIATCTNGVCGVSCNPNFNYNSATNDCVASYTVNSCGPSGMKCATPANGAATCNAPGVCSYTCNSGYTWNSLTQQCVQKATGSWYSATNCPYLGILTQDCTKIYSGLTNGQAICTLTGCAYTCNSGYISKDWLGSLGLLSGLLGGGNYGCVEYTSNSNCCGTSGKQCVNPANGVATCSGGACTYTCNSGYDWDSGSSTCVPTHTTTNCGRCGNTCYAPANGVAVCNNSQCSFTCNPGYVSNGNCCVMTASGAPRSRAKKSKLSLGACPSGEQACPIAGSASLTAFSLQSGSALTRSTVQQAINSGSMGYECIDTQTSIESCGGCSSIGMGEDCSAIAHAKGVGCEAGQCIVFECDRGYHLTSDSKKCIRSHKVASNKRKGFH